MSSKWQTFRVAAGPWIGWILTGLVAAFLAFDAAIKLIKIAPVTEAFQQLGYPDHLARGLGLMQALILLLYLVPRTAVLGAILMTGLLGGAIASHVRLEHPLFSHVLFGLYIGILAWGGLYLRQARVRDLIAFKA